MVILVQRPTLKRILGPSHGHVGETVCILCALRSLEAELKGEDLRRASDARTVLNAITGHLRVTPSLLAATRRLWPEIKLLSSVSARPIPRNPPLST